jgi:hypothetical protein
MPEAIASATFVSRTLQEALALATPLQGGSWL